MKMQPRALCAAILALAATSAAAAPHTSDARTDQVLSYGMSQDQNRFSTLAQINRQTIRRLVPVWNYSLNDSNGQEGQPLVVDGVIYFTTAHATVAVDALTGRQVWKTVIEFKPDVGQTICCGQVNRGGAIFQGRLYRTTLDARVQALDLKTGKVVWESKAADYKDGVGMTGAPLVADGVVITGVAGGEFGVRGFLDGWDPATGKRLWRTYTIPAPGEPGSETWTKAGAWEHGGGPTWLTGSYDPKLGLVYWGVGNGGPWNPGSRPGDNLYTDSVLALKPQTGEIVWHYQFTPNDGYDYDGVNELVQTELKVGGVPHKVILQANRNGYFYVIDRANGRLLAANPFVRVTWADKVDMKTGRPVLSAGSVKAFGSHDAVELWPSLFGGKNWQPMSFSPATGLAYANTNNLGWIYQREDDPDFRKGAVYLGIKFPAEMKHDGPEGYLKAIDPLTGKARWSHPWDLLSMSGVMSTAGGLVFTGSMTGEFLALDDRTGKVLWRFQTGSGMVSQPITWSRNGRQYITVASGLGGVYPASMGSGKLSSVPLGDSLWTFALLP